MIQKEKTKKNSDIYTILFGLGAAIGWIIGFESQNHIQYPIALINPCYKTLFMIVYLISSVILIKNKTKWPLEVMISIISIWGLIANIFFFISIEKIAQQYKRKPITHVCKYIGKHSAKPNSSARWAGLSINKPTLKCQTQIKQAGTAIRKTEINLPLLKTLQ